MDALASQMSGELQGTKQVLGAVEVQEKRWDKQETLRVERGAAAIDKLLYEASDAQRESDRLAEEADHLMMDTDLDLDGEGTGVSSSTGAEHYE